MGKNTTNDMTQGNCMRLLVQFFLPILAGNLFQQLYSFADSMVVGKGIGDTALAAVGNTGSVHFLIIGFAIGLTGGLGICISQSFGSGNYEKLRKELAMSVWICLAIGIVITVVFCKHFLEKNAKYFWRMLHLQIGESCKASAGSYSASYIAIADHI